MPAQTQDTSRPYRDGAIVAGVPVQAGARIYVGALVEIDADGRVAPASKAANKTYYGVCLRGADNTGGAAGAQTITVRRRGAHRFATTGTAARGKRAFVVDDQTVTDVPTAASSCGVIIDSDSGGAWVDLGAVLQSAY